MVQITGQHARIAALSMLTASNRDYPRSTDVAWIRQESSRIRHLWRLTDSESIFSGLAYPCNKVPQECDELHLLPRLRRRPRPACRHSRGGAGALQPALAGRGLGPRGPPRDACARDLRGVRAYVEHRVRAGPDHLRPVLRYQLAPLGRLPRLRRRAGAAAGRGARAPRCAGSRDGARARAISSRDWWWPGGWGGRPVSIPRFAATPRRGSRSAQRSSTGSDGGAGDLVLARHVLEHLADPRGALATLLSVLDPDGAQAVSCRGAERALDAHRGRGLGPDL